MKKALKKSNCSIKAPLEKQKVKSFALLSCYVNEGSQCRCTFTGCVAQCQC